MSFFKSMLSLLIIIFVPLNSYAIQKCITDGIVKEVRIGQSDGHRKECPDDGNCIYFRYSEDNQIKSHYVRYLANLYDILKTSLLTGLKINAWSGLGYCNIESGRSSIDSLSLST